MCLNHAALVFNSTVRSSLKLRVMFLITMFCALVFPASASTPSSGTLGPVKGSSSAWAGSGIAGATTDETTCVDGTDCDVFTVTLTGSPTNYKGLILAISIAHSISLNDYRERACTPCMSSIPP